MKTSVYRINKGINKPIEFSAILYICGLNTFVRLALILILGTALFMYVYRLSHKYGEHGMMKKMARRRVPKVIKNYSRRVFLFGGRELNK